MYIPPRANQGGQDFIRGAGPPPLAPRWLRPWSESVLIFSNNLLNISITLTRVSNYFIYNLVVPLLVIVLLGVATIFMPSDEAEKPGLLLEVLIGFTLYQLLLADYTPQTASVPLIGSVIQLTRTIQIQNEKCTECRLFVHNIWNVLYLRVTCLYGMLGVYCTTFE